MKQIPHKIPMFAQKLPEMKTLPIHTQKDSHEYKENTSGESIKKLLKNTKKPSKRGAKESRMGFLL